MAEKSVLQNPEIINKFLTFSMGEEEYGIGVVHVSEIIKVDQLISVPHSRDYFLGLIDVRKQILPVVDLRKKLGIPGDAPEYDRAIIITIGGKKVGLAVDLVSSVTTFPPDSIDPGPATVKNATSRFIHGIGKIGERFIILLNIEALFTSEELSGLYKR